jgi:phosphinothricin acetyltransferase
MILRVATPFDAANVREIYRPYVESSAISFEIEVPTVHDIATRIASVLPTHPWLVAEDGRDILGYAYAHSFASRAAYRWSVETSIYVRSHSHGQGVGKNLYQALFAILRVQGFREAFAGIALPNPRSVRLHATFGFEPVALYERVGWKLGNWHDVQWWQKPLREAGNAEPTEAIPMSELENSLVASLLVS